MIDPHTPIEEVPLAFLDVETTGLSATMGDRICEVAILRCQNGQVVDALQRLVNPRRSISPGALSVHGITEEMLRDAPPFAEVADDVLALLDGATLVGHNAQFDLGFLHEELARVGVRMPPVIALDTLLLTRRYQAAQLLTATSRHCPGGRGEGSSPPRHGGCAVDPGRL